MSLTREDAKVKLAAAEELFRESVALIEEAMQISARDVLARSPELVSYVAAMGEEFFVDKDGETHVSSLGKYRENAVRDEFYPEDPTERNRGYLCPKTLDAMEEHHEYVASFQDMFGPTFGPWRIDGKDAPIITDW